MRPPGRTRSRARATAADRVGQVFEHMPQCDGIEAALELELQEVADDRLDAIGGPSRLGRRRRVLDPENVPAGGACRRQEPALAASDIE